QDKAKMYFEKGCSLSNNESCNFLDEYQGDMREEYNEEEGSNKTKSDESVESKRIKS
ncbi:sel1 repeat family protein, partial [Helicobacter bilis]